MIRFCHQIAAVFFCLLPLIGRGATEVPEIRIPILSEMPTFTGEVKGEEWREAARIEGMCGRSAESPESLVLQEAALWVGTDGTSLLIAMVSVTPPGGKLQARVLPAANEGNARVSLDDSIEITIAPDPEAKPENRKVFQIAFNARGATSAHVYDSSEEAKPWKNAIESKSKIIGDRWHFQARIPLFALGITPEKFGKGIGLRVGRRWKQQRNTLEETGWNGASASPFITAGMPRVILDPLAPVVQVTQVIDKERENLGMKVSLFNPHEKPITTRLRIDGRPTNSAPAKMDQTVLLAPKERREGDFSIPGVDARNESVQVALNVGFADGKTAYRRQFEVRSDRLNDLWKLDSDAEKKVDVRFAYFPTYNKMRVSINVNGLRQASSVQDVKLMILDANGQIVAETVIQTLAKGAADLIWEIPSLTEGEYTLRTGVRLSSGEIPVIDQKFVRHQFEWEGSKQGLSEAIVPPFIPLRVEKNRVFTVLREHNVSETGLWMQVTSDGKPILSSPIRLEAKGGKKVLEVKGSEMKVTRHSETALETEHDIRIGTVAAKVKAQWEIDGMMLWQLQLLTNEESAIDDLTLVIPLKPEIASLMHTCTDGIRFNYAGMLPAGNGTIWEGSKAPRNSIVGDYVPYIWIGCEKQGLSVFGENDRGWMTKSGTPCQEIVRTGQAVELRCHLITGPAKWDKPRTITIGFQATPTKPMPEKWRTTFMGTVPGDIAATYKELIRSLTFVGSTGSYGSATQAAEPTPRANDFSIWSYLGEVRRTGTIDPAFKDKWLKGYTGIYINSNPPQEMNYGVHVMKSRPQEILAYTNARGVRKDTPEGQTFIDEWIIEPFSNRKVPPLAGVAYEVDPGKSYQDWMLFLYSKMFDTFADHIYWDDVFLASNFDLVATEAYKMDDGRVQPAAGLQNMRNLIKRTAFLGVEKGKAPFNMAHMTNTAIAPILSFSQMIYTWEDKVGELDFQDRWTRDYIRAESIGLQHGAVPIAMTLIRSLTKEPLPAEKAAWVGRTAAGVMMTHEIHPQGGLVQYWEGFRQLLEFGYGTPNVEVFNYWQSDYPLTITGGETSSLLLGKPGELLLVLCDYGEGGNFEVKLDHLGLKLSGPLVAEVQETRAKLPIENGKFSVKLAKHDYVIVRVFSLESSRLP